MIKYLKSVGVYCSCQQSVMERFTPIKKEENRRESDSAKWYLYRSCKRCYRRNDYRCICGSKRFHRWNHYRRLMEISPCLMCPKEARLSFHSYGYQTQEIKWTGVPLNVILSDDTKVLDEVVVVGYGTHEKSECDGCGKVWSVRM